jgi:hypothetical protein
VAALKKEGIDAQVVDGNHGEFTVSVDGKTIVQKTDSLPPVDEIVRKVKHARSASTA